MLSLYRTTITIKLYIMNYQEFILKALQVVAIKPTKEEMQFAYIVLYNGFGLSVKESIIESIKL